MKNTQLPHAIQDETISRLLTLSKAFRTYADIAKEGDGPDDAEVRSLKAHLVEADVMVSAHPNVDPFGATLWSARLTFCKMIEQPGSQYRTARGLLIISHDLAKAGAELL